MRKPIALAAAHLLCAGGLVALPPGTPARADPDPVNAESFPVLPVVPAVEGLIGLPQTFSKLRGTYLALITREAKQRGLPAELADAVAKVESGFNPTAVGGVGEVGLMQVRPQTAAMLGYTGDLAGLFEPEVNVRYGVAYLARAWELAGGDVCRALMKYRAGWGEERMTPLSVEYCRRARGHLAAIGSPLAGGALPAASDAAPSFAARQVSKTEHVASTGVPRSPTARTVRLAPLPNVKPSAEPARTKAASLGPVKQPEAQAASAPNGAGVEPKRQAVGAKPARSTPSGAATRLAGPPTPPVRPERFRVASVGAVRLSDAQAQALLRAREQERARAEQRRQIWAAHEGRMNAITAKLKAPQLKIMSGL